MVSNRIENVALSGTIEINAKTIEMIDDGIDVINLCPGEPDLPTPKHIKDAAKRAIDANKTKYTNNSGIRELKEAIRNKFIQNYNVEYSLSEIIVSNGAKQAIYNALQVIVDNNDEVILPVPYYVSYPDMIRLAGGVPKFVKTQIKNSFKITRDEFKSAINYKTKAIILCSPNNPTGAVYTSEELASIVTIARENNVFVISDEVYESLIYDDAKFTAIVQLGVEYKDHLVTVNGVSKAYSMTGWRIGYAVAPEDIVTGMNKLQSHSTSNACSISQYAALEAISGPQDSVIEQRKIFQRRKDLVHNALSKINGINFVEPHGAFYFFVDINEIINNSNTINNSKEFCLKLLNEGHVATVPGSVFGMENYFRLSYSKSEEELEKAMKRIANTIYNYS